MQIWVQRKGVFKMTIANCHAKAGTIYTMADNLQTQVLCIGTSGYYAKMLYIKSGWVCDVSGFKQGVNSLVAWDNSTNGYFMYDTMINVKCTYPAKIGHIYKQGTTKYLCIGANSNCVRVLNIKSGWVCDVLNFVAGNNDVATWGSSTNGHFMYQ